MKLPPNLRLTQDNAYASIIASDEILRKVHTKFGNS